jgi:hypothetical protein
MKTAAFGVMRGFRMTEPAPTAVGRTSLPTQVFTLALDAGEYQVVLMYEAGCVHCVGTNTGEDGNRPVRCNTVTVSPGEVTPVNVILDSSSH